MFLLQYINGVEAVVDLLNKILARHFKSIKIGSIEIQLRGDAAAAYEATFAKIEKAQANLAEAVDTLDVLKMEYTQESSRLAKLLEEVQRKRTEYRDATKELTFLQNLTEKERNQLKRSLGVDDRKSKVIGFVSGVLASVIATALWVGVPKMWNATSGLWHPERGPATAASKTPEPNVAPALQVQR